MQSPRICAPFPLPFAFAFSLWCTRCWCSRRWFLIQFVSGFKQRSGCLMLQILLDKLFQLLTLIRNAPACCFFHYRDEWLHMHGRDFTSSHFVSKAADSDSRQVLKSDVATQSTPCHWVTPSFMIEKQISSSFLVSTASRSDPHNDDPVSSTARSEQWPATSGWHPSTLSSRFQW